MMGAEDSAERPVDNFRVRAETRRNPWLGRQDSNLRMAVPKTALNHDRERLLVRKVAVIHKLESMAYEKTAERRASDEHD